MAREDARRFDALYVDVNVATLGADTQGYGEIRDGAVGVRDGRIAWVGARRDLPGDAAAAAWHEGRGAWLLPGLVDCHTHAVYAGSRSDEFEARLEGATYEEIARRGGGILSTVRATRAASEDALCAQSLPRVRALMAEGVTTIEIKSGYGLELATEARMLRVARRLAATLPLQVRTTFLGAHALPPEFAGRPDDYIDAVCDEMLPALAREGLVDAVDAFCDTIGFTPAQTERVFRAARALGLPVKLHAEQLSNQHGAALAARYDALSADHLEWLDADGVAAMARAGTVAVLLPGAFYFLRETRPPPIAALRAAGVPLAVASDCNPGSAPIASLLTTLNMACTLFRLTPLEALRGATLNAARALGLGHDVGSIEVGKRADFVLHHIERPAELAYAIGAAARRSIVVGGAAGSSAPA